MERIEAAIMFNLYAQPDPISSIPDRGMQLSPKWQSESEVLVNSFSDHLIHGIDSSFIV
jgi:hypothetical protein